MSFDFPLIDFGKTIAQPVFGESFQDLYHIKLIAHKLEQVFCGCLPDGKKNLIINIPPRHGKTWLTGELFPAWCFGLNPKCRFISTSVSINRARRSSIRIKRLINHPLYQELFPWTKIDKGDTDTQEEWYTTAGGGYYAVGATGAVIGFGAGLDLPGFYGCILIDDPIKAMEARSEVVRKSVLDNLTGGIMTRVNGEDVPIIIIMQRLHPNDPCGWVMKNFPGEWDQLILPCVNDDGSMLWPGKISKEYLDTLKEVDPFTYFNQYQQNPIKPGGNMLKNSWWKTWTQDDLNKCTGLFLTADTAFKKTKGADNSSITVFAYSPEALLMIDQVHGKWEWPDLVKNAKEMHENYRPTKMNELPMGPFIIEDKASGTSLIQQLSSIDGIDVRMWSPKGRDKVFWVRDMLTPLFCGKIKIPVLAPWREGFLEEASAFTEDDSHDHDDRLNTVWIAHDAWRNYASYL